MATFMNESIIIGSDRPTSKGLWPGVALVLALGAAAFGTWYLYGRPTAGSPVPVIPIATTTIPAAPVAREAVLVFLDADAPDAGKGDTGCDGIQAVRLAVNPTPDPAHAALEALFAEATTTDLVPGNFLAAQDDLSLDRAEAHGTDYHVYLTGSVAYAGACDDPRLKVQVEQTVRANRPQTAEVEIFLNGAPYEGPNEKGEE